MRQAGSHTEGSWVTSVQVCQDAVAYRIGASLKQRLHHFGMTLVGCPVQCCVLAPMYIKHPHNGQKQASVIKLDTGSIQMIW